jgi:hypothetical protein
MVAKIMRVDPFLKAGSSSRMLAGVVDRFAARAVPEKV